MHWCGLLIIAVAACSTADSVAIEIETHDPAIVRVELFVAGTPCTNCDSGIAPPGTDPTMPNTKPLGDVSFLVGKDRFDTRVDGDGIAGFLLKPDGQNTMVPKLAAIGFDANGTPLGFVVDDTSFDLVPLLGTKRRYQLESRMVDQAMHSGNDRIITWRTEGTDPAHPPPSCLAIVRHDGETEFFSPKADPDCDGFGSGAECNPTWYDYKTPMDGEPVQCLVDDNGACQVGKLGTCVDGDTAATCESYNKFCVPEIACTRCTPPYDQACLNTIGTLQSATRLHCKVPIFPDSANSNAPSSCSTTSNPVQLISHYPDDCTTGFVGLGDMSIDTSASIDITTPNNEVVGTLLPNARGMPCSVSFSPILTVTSLPPGPVVGKGLFAVTNGGSETLLMPVVVDFMEVTTPTTCVDAASTQMLCDIAPDLTSDTIWSCSAHP
jgi:hypothetical protein